MHTVLQAVVYLNTKYLQYCLNTLLLTVSLAPPKKKLWTELLAAPELTFTNHTEFKELGSCWRVYLPCRVQLSADSVLCLFVITSSAKWKRTLWANPQCNICSVNIAVASWNTADTAICIRWSPVSHILEFSIKITKIFAKEFRHIFSNTAELAHATIHIYTYIYIHAHIHTHVHIYTHAHLFPYLHKYLHTYIDTYTHIFIHSYTYTYTHTYIHTYIQRYVSTYIVSQNTCSVTCKVTLICICMVSDDTNTPLGTEFFPPFAEKVQN